MSRKKKVVAEVEQAEAKEVVEEIKPDLVGLIRKLLVVYHQRFIDLEAKKKTQAHRITADELVELDLLIAFRLLT